MSYMKGRSIIAITLGTFSMGKSNFQTAATEFSGFSQVSRTLSKLQIAKHYSKSSKNPLRTSPFKDTTKQCKQKLKYTRGPLPWEVQPPPKRVKAVLPIGKLADEFADAPCVKYCTPCRYCPPTGVSKKKPKKKKVRKVKPEPCKPFYYKDSEEEKLTQFEKRRIITCKKKSCNPEVECKHFSPVTTRVTKVYPINSYFFKNIQGCPVTNWKEIHKKAKTKCKK